MASTWTGNASGVSFWDDGNNWSPTGVPTLSSSVVSIAESGTYQVVIQNSDPSYTIRSLSIGGTGSNPTLDVLGQLNVQKAITLVDGGDLAVGSLGAANISRVNIGSGSTVFDSGTLNVSGVFSGSGIVAVNGAELFANTIAGTNTYSLANSATMTISQSVSSSGAINFGDGTPDTLNLDSAGSGFGAAVSGFGGGDVIDIGSLTYSSSDTTQYSNSTLTISNGANTLFTFTDIDDPGLIVLADDGAGGTEIETCFLAGTYILTDHGDVAIEQLVSQDLVATWSDGTIIYKPIIWTGGRYLNKAAVSRNSSYPIRILANAFSDAVPRRDLLVTAEHCILVEGQLIPARMLVNGCSIVEDRSVDSYSFHHIELETHGIILAEGLTAESYLDTGNRESFTPSITVTQHSTPSNGLTSKSWAVHACAPLATDRQTVEPIWEALRERATRLGMRDQRFHTMLVDNPQLQLLLNTGDYITARWNKHLSYMFQIPIGATPVRLLSRVSVPADTIGPFIDDRRKLGIQIRSIGFWNGLEETVIKVTDIEAAGWYAAEDDLRWTNGNAALDLPTAVTKDTFVGIVVVGSLLYREDQTVGLLAA